MDILISVAILAGSLGGILYLLGKKIPVLLVYPRQKDRTFSHLKREAAEWVKESLPMRYVESPDLLLQKVLSKTRILSLKMETKTSKWLEDLRKKSQDSNHSEFTEKYWDKVKEKKKVGRKKKESTPA